MSFPKHISLLTSIFLIAGLVFSVSHYHNENMECLNHSEDQHVTENDTLCPVCGITAADLTMNQQADSVLIHETIDYAFTENKVSFSSSYQTPLRAPPLMI